MEMVYWGLQPLARAFIALRIGADAVSWLALVIGVSAGISVALGQLGIGGVLACIAALLDAVDGMIANATHTASPAGKMLDSALDRYVEFFLIGGLAIHLRASIGYQSIALLALFASFMVSYSTALAEIQKIGIPRGSMRRPERMSYLIAGIVIAPLMRTGWESAPLVFVLSLIAVVGNLSALSRLLSGIRELRIRHVNARALSAVPPSKYAAPVLKLGQSR